MDNKIWLERKHKKLNEAKEHIKIREYHLKIAKEELAKADKCEEEAKTFNSIYWKAYHNQQVNIKHKNR